MEFSISGNVPGTPGGPGIARRDEEGRDAAEHDRPGSWRLRPVPQHLRDRYLAEGWWTDATLGQMVADGLGSMGHVGFRARSTVRPWDGTFADVDRAARSLAGELRARGVGPGSLVAFQLPNWVEAGIAFWAAAHLGAVVVPIVHVYGAKEVEYIVRATEPDAVVTADRFGHNEHLAVWEDVLSRHPVPLWLVVGDTAPGGLPAAASPFADLLDAQPLAGPLAADPDAPAIVGFTSGTTRDPKGVVHSHRTIGCETRQLDHMFPTGGPPQITGAPVGHFIGMLNAFLVPMLRLRPVNLIDVWDPGEVLRMMRQEGLGVGGVAEVSVVAAPDERLGEHAAAVLRLRPGAGAPTLADVRQHLAAAGLARQKWPESLHVVDELPPTPSGKVQKFRLRQRLREGGLGPA